MLFFPFLIHLALSLNVLTVYSTNIHTLVNYKTEVATNTITLWSTAGIPGTATTTPINNVQPSITTTLTPNKKTSSTNQLTAIPTAPTTSSEDPTVHLDEFASQIINTHNEKRFLHKDTPNLVYSLEVAKVSQQYAGEYNCNGTLIHHHNILYGENLALGFNTTAAVITWYDEISDYDYNNPRFSEKTGHFTQLVWSNTSLVGCGYKNCGSYYGQYTVCQYYTPGNHAGLFQTYVKPLNN